MTPKNDTITITQNGEEREIFMSFGLLNELATMIQSPEIVPAVGIDPELRETVLQALLVERKKSGKKAPGVDLDTVLDVEVSVEDFERLIEWAQDHVLSFFIRALQKAEAVTKRHQDEMKALVSSSDGSNA